MKKAVLLLLVVAGCSYVPVLVPDAEARRYSDKVAFTEAAGMRVWVNGDAWRSDPLDLSDVLTPVQVHLENHGTQPVRVSYAQLSLVGASGMRYSAVSPITSRPVTELEPADGMIRPAAYHPGGPRPMPMRASPSPMRPPPPPVMGPRPVPHGWGAPRYAPGPHGYYAPRHYAAPRYSYGRRYYAPRYTYRHFYVAPQYSWYYPGYPAWGLPYGYWGSPGTPYIWPRSLPTDDMMELALPEGVLQPGGRVEGFVYFQASANREERLRFTYELLDATTDQKLGEASIPMRVELR